MTEAVRLILAEDDDFLRQLLQMQCESLGAQVAAACDGEEAVSLALSYEYDMVLIDIQMPKCDGIQAMTLLRQLGYDRPIVAMSADEVAAELVSAEGFTSVLKKPLTEQALQQLLLQATHRTPIELIVSDELRQQFLQSLTREHQLVDQAFQAQDWPELQRLSHKLKGSAGSFGFYALSDTAEQLQKVLHSIKGDGVRRAALTKELLQQIQEAGHE